MPICKFCGVSLPRNQSREILTYTDRDGNLSEICEDCYFLIKTINDDPHLDVERDADEVESDE